MVRVGVTVRVGITCGVVVVPDATTVVATNIVLKELKEERCL